MANALPGPGGRLRSGRHLGLRVQRGVLPPLLDGDGLGGVVAGVHRQGARHGQAQGSTCDQVGGGHLNNAVIKNKPSTQWDV